MLACMTHSHPIRYRHFLTTPLLLTNRHHAREADWRHQLNDLRSRLRGANTRCIDLQQRLGDLQQQQQQQQLQPERQQQQHPADPCASFDPRADAGGTSGYAPLSPSQGLPREGTPPPAARSPTTSPPAGLRPHDDLLRHTSPMTTPPSAHTRPMTAAVSPPTAAPASSAAGSSLVGASGRGGGVSHHQASSQHIRDMRRVQQAREEFHDAVAKLKAGKMRDLERRIASAESTLGRAGVHARVRPGLRGSATGANAGAGAGAGAVRSRSRFSPTPRASASAPSRSHAYGVHARVDGAQRQRSMMRTATTTTARATTGTVPKPVPMPTSASVSTSPASSSISMRAMQAARRAAHAASTYGATARRVQPHLRTPDTTRTFGRGVRAGGSVSAGARVERHGHGVRSGGNQGLVQSFSRR